MATNGGLLSSSGVGAASYGPYPSGAPLPVTPSRPHSSFEMALTRLATLIGDVYYCTTTLHERLIPVLRTIPNVAPDVKQEDETQRDSQLTEGIHQHADTLEEIHRILREMIERLAV